MLKKEVKNAIFDIYLYYPRIWTPVLKKDQVHNPSLPFANKQYVIDMLITEEDRRELKKRYKTVTSVKNIREYDAEEFERTFKVKPPYEADTYYTWKITQHASYQNGEDNKKRITLKTMGCDLGGKQFSNGTKGHVQWTERRLNGNSMVCDLKAVCVTQPEFYEDDPFADAEEVENNVSAEDIIKASAEHEQSEEEQETSNFGNEAEVEVPTGTGEDIPF